MKLKVGAKLGLGFGIILLLMLVSGVMGYLKLTVIKENSDRMTQTRVPTMEAARILQDRLDYSANKARQGILAGTDATRKAAAQKAFEEGWEDIDKEARILTELSPHWTHQENRDKLAQVKENLAKIRQAQQATIDAAASGGRDGVIKAGSEYTDQVTPMVNANTKVLSELAESFDNLIKENTEALNSANRATMWTMGISTGLALAIGIVIAMFLGRGISTATTSVLRQAEAIAEGDLTAEAVKVTSEDELGDLTRAINKMHANLRQIIESIAQNAQNVANASEEFSATSQQITANSEETSAQANTVSSATEQINRNLQTVATSTEEMSASISEIAKNASESAKVAGEALKAAVETNATVTKLGESSAEIGQVIKVITSIAQQTNLLALNATIEAARAGEAGKGFAVVANEVKELAKQTAKATEDISQRIAAIQTDAKGAVEAIKTISGIIGQVNDISATIATAVQEQSATTSEMSRNVTEAAKGSGEVAKNITGVAQAAQNTSSGANDSQKAAQQLAQMSTQLRELVGQFKVETNGHGRHASA
ncbi:MAG TPA: methyl-accepting chemotaxis protein [Candidatus Sulfotelmatobacter sp.]|nr:methyl-accepting chemotaxis protein [Candidatus Sulfotelmatobacter sp.]